MEFVDYLFRAPVNGSQLRLLAILFAAMLLVGIGAWIATGRLPFRPQRRRARQLRSIMFWAAVPGAVYLQARYLPIGFFNLRIWYVLILVVWALRLGLWALTLPRLSNEVVDEKATMRKQAYFRRAKTSRPKRRRR